MLLCGFFTTFRDFAAAFALFSSHYLLNVGEISVFLKYSNKCTRKRFLFLGYFASALKKSNFSLESFKFSSVSYAALWHTGEINMQRGGAKLAFFFFSAEKANKNAVFGTFFWLFSADSCKKPIGRFYALKMH